MSPRFHESAGSVIELMYEASAVSRYWSGGGMDFSSWNFIGPGDLQKDSLSNGFLGQNVVRAGAASTVISFLWNKNKENGKTVPVTSLLYAYRIVEVLFDTTF